MLFFGGGWFIDSKLCPLGIHYKSLPYCLIEEHVIDLVSRQQAQHNWLYKAKWWVNGK